MKPSLVKCFSTTVHVESVSGRVPLGQMVNNSVHVDDLRQRLQDEFRDDGRTVLCITREHVHSFPAMIKVIKHDTN